MKKDDNYEGSRQEFVDNLNKAHWKLCIRNYNALKGEYIVCVETPSRPDAWGFKEDDMQFLINSGVIVNAEVKNGKIEIYETPFSADFNLFAYNLKCRPQMEYVVRATITKRDIANSKQYISIQASDKKTDITRTVYSLLRLTPEFKGCYLTETNTICIPTVEVDGVFWLLDVMIKNGNRVNQTTYMDFKKRRYVNR